MTRTTSRLKVAGAGVAAAALLGAGALVRAAVPPNPAPGTTTVSPVVANSPATTRLEELNDAFASVAARVKPSVVYITAVERARAVAQGDGEQMMPQLPPEFAPFFRQFGGPQGMQAPGGRLPGRGTPRGAPHGAIGAGSGFIVSSDGYILTNNHVVADAERVTVRLLDRREFTAKVVGTDPSTDVAVLKIDATGLTPAPLGNSDATRVGEWVLAVGNPMGERLSFTVTQGIISAKGRALDLPNSSARSIQDFIQTDAAINPGNSGGPLVNVRGEVIGINSAIASTTGSYTGYGFAVPISLAHQVMDQIVAHGRVSRAALGISVRDAGADDAAYVGLPSARGVLVEDFPDAGSPARRAGLQQGDVIVAVDGQQVDYVSQLQEKVAFRKAGEMVALDVARKGGARATVRVPLQTVSDRGTTAARTDAPADAGDDARAPVGHLGIQVAPLDGATAQQLQLPSDVRGVVVAGVQDGSPAAGRLAEPGSGGPDVITSVEGTAVQSPADLRAALGRYRAGDIVTLGVYNAPAKTRRVERVRIGG
ncbi:peptidase S1 [Gemmatimonadetes bacterium T265]|nr:peptidase S1 [Gemmatimonadetes bacterium T265]